MKTPMGVFAITLSTLVGLATGYSIAHWRLSSIYAEQADNEIDGMREYYESKYETQIEEEADDTSVEDDIHLMADSPLPTAVVNADTRVEYHSLIKQHYSSEEDEEVAVLEENDPPALPVYKKGDPMYEEVSSETMGMDEYGYDEIVYLTYYYHEDLLVDFWGARVDRTEYVGNIELPKPEEGDDSTELCVINHNEQILVNITIDVQPMPSATMEKNRDYVTTRWLELQAAGERLRAQQGGDT